MRPTALAMEPMASAPTPGIRLSPPNRLGWFGGLRRSRRIESPYLLGDSAGRISQSQSLPCTETLAGGLRSFSGVRAVRIVRLFVQRQDTEERGADGFCVRGGGRGYQNGGPPFANLSPRLSLFSDHLRKVLALKGSLRRAQQQRALDGSGPFLTTLLRRGKGSLRTALLGGDHFAEVLLRTAR